MGGIRGYAAPSEAAVSYRRLIADNAAKQLKQELQSVLLRTCYMNELKRILRGTGVQEDIERVDNKAAQHIRQLIGTSEQHEQCDNITETTATQLQGLLAEVLPPRSVQPEIISEQTVDDSKSRCTEHDRLLCGIRSTNDKIANRVPEHVNIDPELGISYIKYVAASADNTTANDDEYRMNNISLEDPKDHPRRVASITEISDAIESLEMN